MIDWRGWLVRRLARHWGVGDQALAQLEAFPHLGEPFTLESPGEFVDVAVHVLARAARTRSAVEVRPDWVWPRWLEDQLDPLSSRFVPRGHLAFAANLTRRNWTAVGNPWSEWEAIVDPDGLVTPRPGGWSLDWWVRGRAGWVLPSRSPAVTQRLTGPAPVVTTSVPVGDGRATEQVWMTRVGRPGRQARGPEALVVEVTNHTDTARDVALVVRPYDPEGLAVVTNLAVTARGLVVDGHPVVLTRTPTRVVASSARTGDVLAVLAGDAPGCDPPVHDPAGLAHAAVVCRLAPGDQMRAVVPRSVDRSTAAGVAGWRRTGRSGRRRWPGRPGKPPLVSVDEVEDPDVVTDRWASRLAGGLRVRLPDARLAEAVTTSRMWLLVLHDPGSITPGPATYHRFWFRDAAYELAALDCWGHHAEAADVLRSYPRRQQNDGAFVSQWREWDATGQALWSVAEHHRLTGDRQLLEDLVGAVRAGVNWIERVRPAPPFSRRRTGGDRAWLARQTPDRGATAGLLPAGISAEHLGPHDRYYWDNLWAVRGLKDGAYVARTLGDGDAAGRIDGAADRFREDVLRSIRQATRRLGRTVIPAGPARGVDPGMIGSLAACNPLQLLPADHPLIGGTLTAIRERFCLGEAFYQAITHTGRGTYLTLQLAFVELEQGDGRAWQRLEWLVDMATPTWTWPEAIHPRLDSGCMGDGHHGWATAEFLRFVRAVLVRETRDGHVAVLGLLPAGWRGRDLEVADAPTHAGRLSYRLGWDGDRPCLSWRWHRPRRAVMPLCAPALDPRWSTTDPAGEVTFDPADDR